jgi:hypothetical protein
VNRFRLRSPKPPRLVENDVEAQCLDVLRLRQYRPERLHSGTFKSLDGRRFVKMHDKGTPDYVVAHPQHSAFYLETKRPGESPTPEQAKKHIELRVCGFHVVVIDRIEDLVQWLDKHHRKATL